MKEDDCFGKIEYVGGVAARISYAGADFIRFAYQFGDTESARDASIQPFFAPAKRSDANKGWYFIHSNRYQKTEILVFKNSYVYRIEGETMKKCSQSVGLPNQYLADARVIESDR